MYYQDRRLHGTKSDRDIINDHWVEVPRKELKSVFNWFIWIVPLILFVTRGTEMLSNACQSLKEQLSEYIFVLCRLGSMWYVGRGVRCDQGEERLSCLIATSTIRTARQHLQCAFNPLHNIKTITITITKHDSTREIATSTIRTARQHQQYALHLHHNMYQNN